MLDAMIRHWNTWREPLEHIDQPAQLAGREIGVQCKAVVPEPQHRIDRIADLHAQPRLAFQVTFARVFPALAHVFRQKLKHGSLDSLPVEF